MSRPRPAARPASRPARRPSVHLGVDLTDAGAHPAAWRDLGSRAQRLFDARRLTELVATAQRGVLDLVTFDDAFALQPTTRHGVQGRLDAALVAARLAPRSAGIGLVPTIDTTHTEPFHVSKAIATIDHVSTGRAGWGVGWSTTAQVAQAFGRKTAQDEADALDEAREVVGVVGRLWDSWEDDAEIRDAVTGRFIDRDKLHYVDHEGIRFAVKGPSITPRPPQGRPPVVVTATSDDALTLAAQHADVVRLRAATPDDALAQRARLTTLAQDVGRDPADVRVLVDVETVLGDDTASARARLELLDDLEPTPWATDALRFVGTPGAFAQLVDTWTSAGAADGFLVRPSSLSTDLDALVDRVVPLLQSAGLFRTTYPGRTLRDTLGLARPANVFAATA